MNKDIFSEIMMYGMYAKSVYNSKNIFKKIKCKLTSHWLLIKLSNMTDKISPYYEWYSNAIKFMITTNYESDNLNNKKYNYDNKINMEVCSCDIKVNDTARFNMLVSVPMTSNKNPNMKITIFNNKNNLMHFNHIDLIGYNIDYFINNKDVVQSMNIYNCLKAFQNELYNSCKNYLLDRG